MTAAEAKAMISRELMEGYQEWLRDEKEMSDDEYGCKYGWGKGVELHRDNFKSLTVYMNYFFGGRYLPGWVRQGYTRDVIYQLYQEGFLSYKLYSSYDARMRGKTDFYYIPQRTAREIYKAAKAVQQKGRCT